MTNDHFVRGQGLGKGATDAVDNRFVQINAKAAANVVSFKACQRHHHVPDQGFGRIPQHQLYAQPFSDLQPQVYPELPKVVLKRISSSDA